MGALINSGLPPLIGCIFCATKRVAFASVLFRSTEESGEDRQRRDAILLVAFVFKRGADGKT